MEPIQHKKLSTALILTGVLLAGIGIILLLSSYTVAGAVMLLIGAILVLAGLPALILLAAYSAREDLKK